MIIKLCFLTAVWAAAADFPAVERSTDPIIVVYPREGAVLPLSEGEFIHGSVSEPRGELRINGREVSLHPRGGFLAWLPIAPGTFTFRCALSLPDGTTVPYDRSVSVAQPPAALPERPLKIDEDSLWPKMDLGLRPGNWLLVRMKASPGLKAQFRLPRRAWLAMREANPALGIYEGAYEVGPGEEMAASPVEFKLGSGFSSVSAKTRALVSFDSTVPPIATVKGHGTAVVRTGPGEGELFWAHGGTRLVTAGQAAAETKLALSAGQTGWIETKNLEFLLPGAHPPRAETDVITLRATEDSTIVRISLGDRVPFIVEEADDLRSLSVRLHYTYAHTNWIVYNSTDVLVSEVRLKQETSDIVAVTVRLREGQTLWGHHAQFEGNALKIELRRPPRVSPRGSPLAGIKVFLDPGHMPSAPGTTGPLGTREMDVNFSIAKAAEALLIKEGAVPLLSREHVHAEVSLADRPRQAWEKRADLYVSIHNNNLAGGKNPFLKPYGYSIFYYQPHSLTLAREMYRAYQAQVPIPGEELRFGNLLVVRTTGMPAILIESAYLTFPEQEALLLDPKFRETLAQAIVSGLRSYLEKERSRQKEARRRGSSWLEED